MRAFVVLNPVAGTRDPTVVREAIERHLSGQGWPYEIYETRDGESIADIVRGALDQDFDLFVAVGGDGTLSGVAGGLVHTDVPMGIVPNGTGNVLARDLGVPAGVQAALKLLTGEHTIKVIDAMELDDRFFFLNVGVGVSALAMRDTDRPSKRIFGRIAYIWTGIRKLFGHQPRAFTLVIDGRSESVHASEVVIANSGAAGDPAFRWSPDVQLDDGRLDVCIIYARTALDYLKVAWNALAGKQGSNLHILCRTVEKSVTVKAEEPLPAQADGEFVGRTPVKVRLVSGAVEVIVPTVKRGLLELGWQ